MFDLKANPHFVRRPDETLPFAIITVSRDGRFSTFSPELVGMKSQRYGDFFIGNVEDDPFEATLVSRRAQLFDEIDQGIKACQNTCPYFAFCGGAYLSNRIVEHDDFCATETNACRLHRQALSKLVVDRMWKYSTGRMVC